MGNRLGSPVPATYEFDVDSYTEMLKLRLSVMLKDMKQKPNFFEDAKLVDDVLDMVNLTSRAMYEIVLEDDAITVLGKKMAELFDSLFKGQPRVRAPLYLFVKHAFALFILVLKLAPDATHLFHFLGFLSDATKAMRFGTLVLPGIVPMQTDIVAFAMGFQDRAEQQVPWFLVDAAMNYNKTVCVVSFGGGNFLNTQTIRAQVRRAVTNAQLEAVLAKIRVVALSDNFPAAFDQTFLDLFAEKVRRRLRKLVATLKEIAVHPFKQGLRRLKARTDRLILMCSIDQHSCVDGVFRLWDTSGWPSPDLTVTIAAHRAYVYKSLHSAVANYKVDYSAKGFNQDQQEGFDVRVDDKELLFKEPVQAKMFRSAKCPTEDREFCNGETLTYKVIETVPLVSTRNNVYRKCTVDRTQKTCAL